MMIHTERVYKPAEPKERTSDIGGPTVAPRHRIEGTEDGLLVRKWFTPDAARWDELKRRRFAESASSPVAWSAPAVLVSSDEVMLL